MPQTSSERVRKFRKKLKQNSKLYEVYKTKDRQRKKAERRKPKFQSAAEIAQQKKLNRDRVRKHRILKKEKRKLQQEGQDQGISPYSTPQALGKAVVKVKPHLPKSPRKRKAVIEKLASSTGIQLPKKRKKEFGGNSQLSPEVKQKVYLFYVQDSVSRQSPGKKDFVVCWKNGKKQHLQKRHLLLSLREAHALFLKENPEVKIGLSKFSSLRPLNVLLSSEIPRNVCLCQYHENIKLICDCLKKEIPEFPNYSSDLVANFVCSSDSETCMFGKCAKCPDWLKTISEGVDLEGPATWYEWKRVETVSPTGSKKDS